LIPLDRYLRFSNTDSGLVKFRFELSTLPEHAKEPTLVVRILEVLTPITCSIPGYDGSVVEPREGQLLSRRTFSGRVQNWAYPLNSRRYGSIWKEFIENSSITRLALS